MARTCWRVLGAQRLVWNTLLNVKVTFLDIKIIPRIRINQELPCKGSRSSSETEEEALSILVSFCQTVFFVENACFPAETEGFP